MRNKHPHYSIELWYRDGSHIVIENRRYTFKYIRRFAHTLQRQYPRYPEFKGYLVKFKIRKC